MKSIIFIDAKNSCTCTLVTNSDNGTNAVYLQIDSDTSLNPKLNIEPVNGYDAQTITISESPYIYKIPAQYFTASTIFKFKITDDTHTGDMFSVAFPITITGNTVLRKIDNFNYAVSCSQKNDSGWQDATLTSQFELYTSSQRVRYRKIGKVVHVEGVLKPTSDIAGSATAYTMFTLPSGYRPARNQIILCKGSSYYTWLCNCGANGNVTFSRYGTGSSYATCSTSHWLPFNFTFMVD